MNSKSLEDRLLSSDQKAALKILTQEKWPILITGGAGTGKSELLKTFVAQERSLGSVAVAAPTGIAALNVDGLTLHSLFGLGITGIMQPNSFRKTNSEYFRNLRLLVIDEVSMMRVDVMNTVDQALRFHRQRKESFGGLKLVLFGDPYQLPPVISGNDKWEDNRTKEKVLKRFPFFFHAAAFKERELRVLSLTTLHRQANQVEFTRALNRIRDGNHSLGDLAYLTKNSSQHEPSRETLRIFGKNDVVEDWNAKRLADLGEVPQKSYAATWETNQDLITNFREYYKRNSGQNVSKIAEMFSDYEARVKEAQRQAHNELNPWEKNLILKEGARVIFTKNDPGGRWVNGSTGTIASLGFASAEVRMDRTNSIVDVTPAKFEKSAIVWTVSRNDKVRLSVEIVGWFKQLPLRLGWAITVHKSQGQTLDSAVLDFDDQYFEKGQAYVALSRVRSLENLYFQSIPKMKDILAVDSRVQFFMRKAEVEPFTAWKNPEEVKEQRTSRVYQIAEGLGYTKESLARLLEQYILTTTRFENSEKLLDFIADSEDPGKMVRIIKESFE